MNIIDYKVLTPFTYKFVFECDNCHNIYEINGTKKYIKGKINSISHGCPYCGKTNGMDLNKFLYKIKEQKYYEKYEYPNIENEYIDGEHEINIICKKHGKFKCTPYKHLKTINGGCPKCIKNMPISKKTWLDIVNKLNNYKYKYPNIDNEYHNLDSIITIECPIHGEFKQLAGLHYRGCQCKRCAGKGVKFDKNDKLTILTEYDLLSMDWAVILDLIGEDKLPKEFNRLCKFGKNTEEREKIIEELKEKYNYESTEVANNIGDNIDINSNNIEDIDNDNNSIEVTVDTIDNKDINNFSNSNIIEDKELKPFKDNKDIGTILGKNTKYNEIFSVGDKWEHVITKQKSQLWTLVFSDEEAHNTKTIDNIKSKLSEELTEFERYLYTEFLKEYNDAINLEIL